MAQSQITIKRDIQVIDMTIDQVHKKPIDANTCVNQDARPAPIDLAHMATRLGLPLADMATYLKESQQYYRHALTELQQALATNDRHSLQQQAHKISGSAALLGVEPLLQAASALEQASAEATSAELDALIQQLIKQLQPLLDQEISS